MSLLCKHKYDIKIEVYVLSHLSKQSIYMLSHLSKRSIYVLSHLSKRSIYVLSHLSKAIMTGRLYDSPSLSL